MLIFKKYICTACGHEWELAAASGSSQDLCPACGRERVRRIDAGVGQQNSRMIGLYWSAAGLVAASGHNRRNRWHS
jgi:predicted RNA-binding Zn-ribbon protein involved in translation (DUF1610 family)